MLRATNREVHGECTLTPRAAMSRSEADLSQTTDGRREPYRQTVEEVAASQKTDVQSGLTERDARARLEQYGLNELTNQAPVPGWRRFLRQFQNALVVLLLIAAAVSAGLWAVEREAALPYEALAIFAVVVLNAAMGHLQESRAMAATQALRAMSAAEGTAIRGGKMRRVPASTIVPGDLIVIEEGDTIPADARVVESIALQTAEATLSGESLPVSKDTSPHR